MHDRIAGQVPYEQQRGVAAGDDQHHAGVGQRAVLQGVGRHMAREVVHAVQRDSQRVGEALGGGDADLEGAREAGAGGDGDGVDVGHLQPRVGEGGPYDRGGRVHMGARRDLRNDAAVPRVLVHTGRDGVAQQYPVLDQTGSGLVAGRLDSQHHR